MKLAEKNDQAREVLHSLYEKCWEDAQFFQDLQASPEEVLKESLGAQFKPQKEDYTIVVEDQTDKDVIYLNIPRKINLDDFELTDEEMEMVAGGIVGLTVIIGIELIAIGYLIAAIADQ